MLASYQNRWWIVISAMAGLMVGSGCINVFVFAVFLKPVSSDLGVSRTAFSSGLALAMLLCCIASPVVGGLTDRWGARRMLLIGIPMYAATIAAFALMDKSLLSIYSLFALAGVIGTTHNTVPYAKVVSTWFNRNRGLALGIATSGMGLGVTIVPALTSFYIQWMGWRLAYVALAGTILVFSLIPVFLFVAEPTPDSSDFGKNRACATKPTGLTSIQAALSWRFWVLGTAVFVGALCINGTLVDVVAMLTDRGMAIERAVVVFSTAGLAMIAGRVVCGCALDRFSGPLVASSVYVVAASGIVILASGADGVVPIIGTMLCGLGLGGLINLVAFFASRYFGLLAYGSIFGTLFGLLLLGSGVGPYLNALLLEYNQDYTPTLTIFAGMLLAVSLSFVSLGPYPYAARPTQSSPAETTSIVLARATIPTSARSVINEMQQRLLELEVLVGRQQAEIADLRERHQMLTLTLLNHFRKVLT